MPFDPSNLFRAVEKFNDESAVLTTEDIAGAFGVVDIHNAAHNLSVNGFLLPGQFFFPFECGLVVAHLPHDPLERLEFLNQIRVK